MVGYLLQVVLWYVIYKVVLWYVIYKGSVILCHNMFFRISWSFDIDFYEETLDISGRSPWIHHWSGPIFGVPVEIYQPSWDTCGDTAGIPSGEHTKSYGKSPFLMGKSTISMAIFNCYVSSPEGSQQDFSWWDSNTQISMWKKMTNHRIFLADSMMFNMILVWCEKRIDLPGIFMVVLSLNGILLANQCLTFGTQKTRTVVFFRWGNGKNLPGASVREKVGCSELMGKPSNVWWVTQHFLMTLRPYLAIVEGQASNFSQFKPPILTAEWFIAVSVIGLDLTLWSKVV